MSDSKLPGVIRRLDQVVVNRIAAGEVIQRPSNALKELLENSLDAKSTNITVLAAGGGMQMLQITDNGTGIRRDDLEIVCERFTTSKLQTFADLSNISTYGFRGEALASISHVAHLSIVTRTQENQCGFKAQYSDGKLVSKPKPCAANQGTQIIVEDLFFNVPTRKLALKSSSDEFNRIYDVVAKYAIHNSGVGFTLKKVGETGNEIRTQVGSSCLDNISVIYGSSMAKELIPFEKEEPTLGLKAAGYISNANFNVKKVIFLLFINHRLVDSGAIRRALEMVYSAYLPKGSHPFMYLSLEIDPRNVDVNVHPTKHEVHFLHQDEIVETIQKAVDSVLLGSNVSRTFYTQTLMPGAALLDGPLASSSNSTFSSVAGKMAAPAPKDMVRTDPREQKLDQFLTKLTPKQASRPNGDAEERPAEPLNDQLSSSTDAALSTPALSSPPSPSPSPSNSSTVSSATASGQARRIFKLKSLFTLRTQVTDEMQSGLRQLIANHSFVGCISRQFALVQHQTKLYVVNTPKMTEELFYQLCLENFGNFGVLRLSSAVSIRDLAMFALDEEDEDSELKGSQCSSAEKVAEQVVQCLCDHASMLDDYFSLEIDADKGLLLSIPLLLENYVPSLNGLPQYLLRLASRVSWEDEMQCFRTFARETARFYAVSPDENSFYDAEQHDEDACSDPTRWKLTIEHTVYPAAKKVLKPAKRFVDESVFVQVANLPDLYKVFERC